MKYVWGIIDLDLCSIFHWYGPTRRQNISTAARETLNYFPELDTEFHILFALEGNYSNRISRKLILNLSHTSTRLPCHVNRSEAIDIRMFCQLIKLFVLHYCT